MLPNNFAAVSLMGVVAWLTGVATTTTADSSAIPETYQAVVCQSEITNKSYNAMDDWLFSLPVPQPKEQEVLIRVVGSSVNPCDVDLVKSFEAVLAHALHKTLGFDVSGVVAAVGPDCKRLKVGDEVWTDLGEMGLKSGVVEMGSSVIAFVSNRLESSVDIVCYVTLTQALSQSTPLPTNVK